MPKHICYLFCFFLLITKSAFSQNLSTSPSLANTQQTEHDLISETLNDSMLTGSTDPYIHFSLYRAFIKHLPIRDFSQYLKLFPSAWIQDKQVHVRGGRGDKAGI